MGTRGAVGFHSLGLDKISYNHFDSYPSGLGQAVMDFIKPHIGKIKLNRLRKRVESIKMVDSDSKPTAEEVEFLLPLLDEGVSEQTSDDWYCLLRKAQGDLQAYADYSYMIEGKDFLADSLFCEYAYIINLDDETLEFYKGFQEKPHTLGRYCEMRYLPEHRQESKYYPVALVAAIPFKDLVKVKDFDKYLHDAGILKDEEVE